MCTAQNVMRWAGYVACSICDEKIKAYRVCWENARKYRCWLHDNNKIYFFMLNMKLCTVLIWLRIGTNGGLLWTRSWTFELIKCEKVVEYLGSCEMNTKDHFPWSFFFISGYLSRITKSSWSILPTAIALPRYIYSIARIKIRNVPKHFTLCCNICSTNIQFVPHHVSRDLPLHQVDADDLEKFQS
jgi:hypothetical protein